MFVQQGIVPHLYVRKCNKDAASSHWQFRWERQMGIVCLNHHYSPLNNLFIFCQQVTIISNLHESLSSFGLIRWQERIWKLKFATRTISEVTVQSHCEWILLWRVVDNTMTETFFWENCFIAILSFHFVFVVVMK